MPSEDTTSTSYTGPGLLGFVFLIFLVLKLLGLGMVATWSWWAVTAPLWAPVALIFAGTCVYLLLILLVGFVALVRVWYREQRGSNDEDDE